MHALTRHLVIAVALGLGVSAEAQDRSPAAGQLVSIEVAIVELGGAGEKLGDTPDGQADQLVARLRELESQGKLAAITRVRFATIEEQPASAQFGENASVLSGRNVVPSRTREGGFAAASSPMFTQRQFGTLVSATPRVEDDGSILMELQVEKTGLGREARPTDGATDENAVPPRSVTINLRSTIRVPNGQTVIAHGMQSNSGKDSAQTVILVTARANGADGRRTPKRQTGRADSDVLQTKIYALRHLNATSAVEVLTKLMTDKSLRIAADPHTNSLLANGPPDQLATIEAILLRLDAERDAPAK